MSQYEVTEVGGPYESAEVDGYTAGYAAGQSAGTAAPGNVLDVTAPSLSGNPYEAATVTTAPGTWYPAADSYTYAYDLSPSGVGSWTPVSGQTSSTILGTAAMEGLYLRGRVVGVNSAGSGTETPTSNVLGPFIAIPYFTVAPVISGTPTVGQALTCDGGTVGGGGTVTRAYQWQADGVDISGATSATFVLTSSEIGALVTCDVTPSNEAGSGPETASNALGPVESGALVPTRAGPDPTSTNAALQDSSGQLTDSGAPSYNYPALYVDELGADGLAVEAGDTVGIAYYHDTITGGSLGTLVGLPSTVRLAGLGDCSTVDRVSGVSLTGIATILLDFQVDFNAASRQWLIDTAGTGWSIYVEPTTSGRIRVSTKAGAVFTMTGLSPVYNNARLQLACRLSGTSSQARLYDGTGTLISSNSATGTAPTPGSHDLVGLNGAGTDPLLGTLHRFATWTTALTDGQADDVAAGTNDHGPQNDADGLKTGVYDDADQTRLIWSTTGTNPVTAE